MKLRKKKLLTIYFSLAVFAVILSFLLFENIKLFVKYKEVDAQHQQNIIKIENEKQKEEDIMKEMEKLETVKGQEWIMIEKGNFMKPGEKKIQIIDY